MYCFFAKLHQNLPVNGEVAGLCLHLSQHPHFHNFCLLSLKRFTRKVVHNILKSHMYFYRVDKPSQYRKTVVHITIFSKISNMFH